MNVIAKISCYFERGVVTLKLRKEYLNSVTHTTSVLLRIKYWTVWCIERYSMSTYTGVINCQKTVRFFLAHPVCQGHCVKSVTEKKEIYEWSATKYMHKHVIRLRLKCNLFANITKHEKSGHCKQNISLIYFLYSKSQVNTKHEFPIKLIHIYANHNTVSPKFKYILPSR